MGDFFSFKETQALTPSNLRFASLQSHGGSAFDEINFRFAPLQFFPINVWIVLFFRFVPAKSLQTMPPRRNYEFQPQIYTFSDDFSSENDIFLDESFLEMGKKTSRRRGGRSNVSSLLKYYSSAFSIQCLIAATKFFLFSSITFASTPLSLNHIRYRSGIAGETIHVNSASIFHSLFGINMDFRISVHLGHIFAILAFCSRQFDSSREIFLS